jgi:murein DD-endopeptidase MepM/ murein hydrolase activator NlpD
VGVNLLKIKVKNIKLWLILLGCLGVILLTGWLLLKLLEGEKPVITLDLANPYLNVSQTLAVTVSDEKSGLRRIWIGLVKDGKEVALLDQELPSAGLFSGGKLHQATFKVEVEPRKIGMTDGKATLRMIARDYSWRAWWHGNRTYVEKEVTIDTKPPEVEVLTNVHNVSQGGAGLVIFKISEPCLTKGVYAGGNFFPGYSGYFKDPNIIMVFFALNYEQGPGTELFVKVSDYAGNSARTSFPHYLRSRAFKRDMIEISDNFLNSKMPEFDIDIPADSKTPMLDKFLKVNRDLRQADYGQITRVVAKTDNNIYWDSPFLQLPNSERKAGFADHRKYKYKGPVIDEQVHLGIDLAALANSPVPASNNGKVVFTGPIGIYGKTVIIDHGFGLFSMYSHLSVSNVQEGQSIAKNEIIGRTGTTGLAGGDHLHFSMLVQATFVDPHEWWDAAWIKNNITSKIQDVKSIIK